MKVNGRTLEAERVFLDVGARAAVPDLPGVKDVPFFDNSSIMAVDFTPRHLVIVGGSYIGLEFAQMYRRFGSEVTVVERAPQAAAARGRRRLGGDPRHPRSAKACSCAPMPNAWRSPRKAATSPCGLECKRGRKVAEGSHVLLAVGRTPNTADLGLDAAGVEVDERGYIEVDDECRTSAEGVWALGECNGKGAFTHTSYNDYEIVAANLSTTTSAASRTGS